MDNRISGSALALVLCLAVAAPAVGQEYDEQAVMAAYEKAMTPSAPHAELAELEGTWEMTVTQWMQPGAEPVATSATNTSRMVLGGRYLMDTTEGTAMGQPFSGMGWTGYDNVRDQYVSTWIDNFGTGILVAYGQWEDDEQGIVMHGTYVDPVTGKDVHIRTVSRMDGPDRQIFTWYEKREGEQVARKTMEIVSVRRVAD